MIVFKNLKSDPETWPDQDMEIVITVDESVKGCRIKDTGPMVMPFYVGDEICMSQMEPGQIFVFQPLGTADDN